MKRLLIALGFLICITLHSNCSESGNDGFPNIPVPSDLSFDCGGVATCNIFLPICEASTGGANPSSTNYACQGMPELCVESYSCECLEQSQQFSSHSCQSNEDGEITVSIKYP
ncbi:MAG TPA: hypothetical protein PKC21_05365 [Oligoflexia bacterium]|nr:hypothetical protein [Oligoflexia bacterium]HMR24765.1 hypothetical protein [Oligoflexia bacterium]